MRTLVVLAVLFLPLPSLAFQQPAPWHDDLVDHLAGDWAISGKVTRHEAHHEVHAEWVLNHQFLRIHEKTTAEAPKTEHPYEAFWFLGYDPDSRKYVLHLMDVFGGKYSETVGYGTRDGNEIQFLFDYPDGPFQTVYRWNPAADTWEWIMDQKSKGGQWTPFADLKLTRMGANPPKP